jgi:hypothetical protein
VILSPECHAESPNSFHFVSGVQAKSHSRL